MFTQQGDTLGPAEDTQGEGGDTQALTPTPSPARNQHPAPAGRWLPLLYQCLGLTRRSLVTVIEDQQAREGLLPDRLYMLHLLIKLEISEARDGEGRTAGSDLGGNASGVGEAEPEDASSEELAVAVEKLCGQVGFPNAT